MGRVHAQVLRMVGFPAGLRPGVEVSRQPLTSLWWRADNGSVHFTVIWGTELAVSKSTGAVLQSGSKYTHLERVPELESIDGPSLVENS